MSQYIRCSCGRTVEVPDAKQGKPVRCPVCDREMTVAKPEPIWELREPAGFSGKALMSVFVGMFFMVGLFSGIPAILLGQSALRDIDRAQGRLRGRGLANVGVIFGVFGCLFTLVVLLSPFNRGAGEAARRSQCVNNLKQFGLAMHNYHESNGCLPPAAIIDQNGKPLLSWRVALLPYLEQTALYDKFHLDEPWDSPHNIALLEPMPHVFACPSDPKLAPGMTKYQTVIGPDMGLNIGDKRLTLQDFTDGTSNTILIGESERAVPWTKPDDQPFDPGLPLTGLKSFHPGGFNALFVDGSVKFLKTSINPSVLRALLTRSGGEVISPDSY